MGFFLCVFFFGGGVGMFFFVGLNGGFFTREPNTNEMKRPLLCRNPFRHSELKSRRMTTHQSNMVQSLREQLPIVMHRERVLRRVFQRVYGLPCVLSEIEYQRIHTLTDHIIQECFHAFHHPHARRHSVHTFMLAYSLVYQMCYMCVPLNEIPVTPTMRQQTSHHILHHGNWKTLCGFYSVQAHCHLPMMFRIDCLSDQDACVVNICTEHSGTFFCCQREARRRLHLLFQEQEEMHIVLPPADPHRMGVIRVILHPLGHAVMETMWFNSEMEYRTAQHTTSPLWCACHAWHGALIAGAQGWRYHSVPAFQPGTCVIWYRSCPEEWQDHHCASTRKLLDTWCLVTPWTADLWEKLMSHPTLSQEHECEAETHTIRLYTRTPASLMKLAVAVEIQTYVIDKVETISTTPCITMRLINVAQKIVQQTLVLYFDSLNGIPVDAHNVKHCMYCIQCQPLRLEIFLRSLLLDVFHVWILSHYEYPTQSYPRLVRMYQFIQCVPLMDTQSFWCPMDVHQSYVPDDNHAYFMGNIFRYTYLSCWVCKIVYYVAHHMDPALKMVHVGKRRAGWLVQPSHYTVFPCGTYMVSFSTLNNQYQTWRSAPWSETLSTS
jgi:hypothetical protein